MSLIICEINLDLVSKEQLTGINIDQKFQENNKISI